MILSIVLLLFVGLIAYLHYIQGLLNGLISAVLAVSAAALALGYYEPMATAMSGGKYNDQSQGICLIVLFAGIYLVGRVLFDKLISGNVRLPHLADAIGGAVCGVIAGLMGAGIVAIALQSMPFGPSIAGYSRYPLSGEHERLVAVPESGNPGRQVDRLVIDELKNADIEKDPQGLLLPVDDIVVGLVKHLSNGGSLAGDQPFESIHPDLLQEYFAQRIGIETGAKHTAANNAKGTQVELQQVNVITAPIPKKIGEFPSVWQNPPKGNLTAEGDTYLVTATVVFKNEAGDDDHLVRLGASAVRLVVPTDDGGYKNLYPLGTVQLRQAWLNKPDDYLFIDVSKEDHGANFLFQVDKKLFVGGGGGAETAKSAAGGKAPAAQSVSVKPGAFIEVKRLAKLSLDDAKVVVGWPPDQKKYYPMRKAEFYKEDQTPDAPAEATATPAPAPTETPNPKSVSGIAAEMNRRGGRDRGTPADAAPAPAPTTPAPTTPTPTAGAADWTAAPLEQPAIKSGDPLPVGINVGTADPDADVVTAAASGHVTARKFDALDVDTSAEGSALTELPKGTSPVNQLMAPAGKRLVAVTMNVKAGGDPWAWAPALGDFTVVDGAGTSYKPNGVIAVITKGAAQRLLASYKAAAEVTSVNKVEGGTVSNVTLLYAIPADQKAKSIAYKAATPGLPLEQ